MLVYLFIIYLVYPFPTNFSLNFSDFLNVDDDEQDEIADDHIPDDDEERFTETTGWSSRTRYLILYIIING